MENHILGNKSGHSQAIIDENEVEILENNQIIEADCKVIEQAENNKFDRQIAEKSVERYLDGKQYDLDRITAEVIAHVGQVVQGYIEVGRRLLAVKIVEGHGNFSKWLEENFSLSRRTAYNFMQVANKLEQRPELAPLANGGIKKALVLLDMPEEYKDEYVEVGTVDGRPLDKYTTMTHQELLAEVKKLKNNMDKQVAEETKGLTKERDMLIEKNKRLQKFKPTDDTTPAWCLEHIRKIQAAALEVTTLCRTFVQDERLKEDFPTQAQIEMHINVATKSLRDLEQLWNETFTLYEG
jgi:hypothetical protein